MTTAMRTAHKADLHIGRLTRRTRHIVSGPAVRGGCCASWLVVLVLLLVAPVQAQPVLAETATPAQPQAPAYVAGEDYQVLAQPLSAPADDTIHVAEFFLYSCPHCYALDAAVTDWAATLPADVVFRRVPVVFGNGGRFYARLYYTAQALGVLERLHAKIFAAIHRQGRDLSTLAAARALFVANGVAGDSFAKTFNSPAIDKKVAHAVELMRAFQVRAVPSIGVAGRYWISGSMLGSNEAMFDVADYLIRQTRSSR